MIRILVMCLFLVACQADTRVNDFIVVNKHVEYTISEDGVIDLENDLSREETPWAENTQRVCAKMIYNNRSKQFEMAGCNQ